MVVLSFPFRLPLSLADGLKNEGDIGPLLAELMITRGDSHVNKVFCWKCMKPGEERRVMWTAHPYQAGRKGKSIYFRPA